MTYHNAIKYVRLAPCEHEHDDKFEHIRTLCAELGDPQKRLSFIRLAGSNGKTLCGGMLTSILKRTDITVGYLAMPIREDLKQNILISCLPLSMEETVHYTKEVALAVARINERRHSDWQTACSEKIDGESAPPMPSPFVPTSSELLLAMALLAFRDKNCKICLIECDHTSSDPSHFLPAPFAAIICGTIPNGDRHEIARIRSYICRGIQEIVSAPQDPDAHRILADTCASVNCRLTLPLKSALEILRLSLRATEFSYKGQTYTLNLCGRFQVFNALIALETIEMLGRRGYAIPHEAIIEGLSSLQIHSKFEVISSMPCIIADSTHTPIAIRTVCDSMTEFRASTGNHVRLCLPSGELPAQYLSALEERGYTVEHLVLLASEDEETPTIDCDIPITVCKTPKQTAKQALAGLGKDGFLLISGHIRFTEKVRYEILSLLGF